MVRMQLAMLASHSGQCSTNAIEPSPPPPPSIAIGVTHLWTTPVFRMQLTVPSESEAFLGSLNSSIMRRFKESSASCASLQYGQSLSDRFFLEQLEAFERDEVCFLESEPDTVAAGYFATLKSSLFSNAQQYLSAAAGTEAAEDFFENQLHVFAWASVHEGCSVHVPHVHENTAISGVFYVSVPVGSGALLLNDPRGGRPPFHRNQISHVPLAGELVLFPPWLVHSVAPSCHASGPRVSLSFNILSEGSSSGGSSAGTTDWERLSDTSVEMSPDEEM